MDKDLNGELVPVGGGDPIPLIRAKLSIGRRESCDICIRFPNVSGLHAELAFRDGTWYIKDLGSTNGIKINGNSVRAAEKRLHPGDEINIAKRRFLIEFVSHATHDLADDLKEDDIMSQSLLEKAGLAKPKPREGGGPFGKKPGPRSVGDMSDS